MAILQRLLGGEMAYFGLNLKSVSNTKDALQTFSVLYAGNGMKKQLIFEK